MYAHVAALGTPFDRQYGYSDCSGYVAQALSLGVTQAEIEEFKRYNSNSDGTWDCHRLLDAFGGQREQQTQASSPVVQAIATATPLPPPMLPTGTTGGDPRMFLTMNNVPDTVGGGAPNRQLAPFVSSGMSGGAGSGFLGIGGSGGLNLTTILILAAVGFGAWYLMKKG